MNKKPKPSRKRKGATAGIVICFVAAIAIVGTYTLRDYQEAKKQQMALAEETDETKDKVKEETKPTNNNLVVNTPEEPAKASLPEPQPEPAKQETDTNTGTSSGGTNNAQQTAGQSDAVIFTEDSELLWPVDGKILLNYSMDKTVYFPTLDQYKYNPAMIISGAEGDQVICGSTGIVKSIDASAQTGTTVNIDLGNGYELFYGQLKDVPVKVGEYVEAKTVLGYVSQPTKYYSVEGCNVYFEMKKDGQSINPMDYMSE